MKKVFAASLMAVVLASALSACGGKDASAPAESAAAGSGAAAAQELNITAKNFQFDKAEYKVKAGEPLKVSLTNEQGVHGVKIDGLDVDLKGKQSTTVTPKAGTYKIVCSVACGTGHKDMVSTLVVE